MRCPRCVQKIHQAAISCPHCGFTVEHADELFGNEDVVISKFSDPAGVLRMKDRKPMRKLLARFEKKFPQLFVSVYLGAFEEMTSIRIQCPAPTNKSFHIAKPARSIPSSAHLLLRLRRGHLVSFTYSLQRFLGSLDRTLPDSREDLFRIPFHPPPSLLQNCLQPSNRPLNGW